MTEVSQTQPTSSKAPSHHAYSVRDRANGESVWTRLGAAWPHADGQGFGIQLESLPFEFDGRISLRIPSEKKQ